MPFQLHLNSHIFLQPHRLYKDKESHPPSQHTHLLKGEEDRITALVCFSSWYRSCLPPTSRSRFKYQLSMCYSKTTACKRGLSIFLTACVMCSPRWKMQVLKCNFFFLVLQSLHISCNWIQNHSNCFSTWRQMVWSSTSIYENKSEK